MGKERIYPNVKVFCDKSLEEDWLHKVDDISESPCLSAAVKKSITHKYKDNSKC